MASKTARNLLLLAVVIHWVYDTLITGCFMVRGGHGGPASKAGSSTKHTNLSQKELAAIAGMHRTYVSQIERELKYINDAQSNERKVLVNAFRNLTLAWLIWEQANLGHSTLTKLEKNDPDGSSHRDWGWIRCL
ncbi:helix-turn-helix domain-containing protein [Pseudomonas sp. ABY48]|uniref:helix-turn-helix domain-containing protein n=1 Tax=Pseudomonas sp. ABY48 TaxID=3402865 RepID=UPI003B4376FC